jgi:hypothetical protein
MPDPQSPRPPWVQAILADTQSPLAPWEAQASAMPPTPAAPPTPSTFLRRASARTGGSVPTSVADAQAGAERQDQSFAARLLASPVTGAQRMFKGMATLGRAFPGGEDVRGWGVPAPGPVPSRRETAAGASDVIGGGMEAGTLLLPEAFAAAPLRVGAGLLVGTGVGEAVHLAGERLGIPREYVDLAAHTLGLASGIAAGHVADSPKVQASILAEAQRLREFSGRMATSQEGSLKVFGKKAQPAGAIGEPPPAPTAPPTSASPVVDRKQQLEDLATDEAMGVKFPEDAPSHFPDGSDAVNCTNCAHRIIQLNGGQGDVYGWGEGTNPTSVVAGPAHGARLDTGQGHDFAVLDNRYLVDAWGKNVEGSAPRAVFDLEDAADRAEVRRLFGDPSTWVKQTPGVGNGWTPGAPAQLQRPEPLVPPQQAGHPTLAEAPAIRTGKSTRPALALTPEAAAEHLARAPVERVGERLLVSPRILGAQGRNFVPAEPGRILLPTIEAAAQDPEYFAKLAAHARESPMLTPREARLSDKGVVSAFADRGAENIDALFGMAAPGVRARGGEWYPGGQGIGDAIAKDAGLPSNAGMGAIARLSPGTDWDMNIDNAQRLGRWWKTFSHETDQPFTQAHFDQYMDSTLAQAAEWIKSKKLTGDKLAKYQALTAKKIATTRSYIDHPWSALPYEQRAQLIRAHSELNEPQTFARYAPEGHIVIPEAQGVNGKPLSVKWQSYDNLARVLRMFDDPSDASISYLLGKGHKIRSFFNDLSVPTDPRSVTADVHNVAGTQLRPLGANRPEVLSVTGGTPGSALTGIEGTYPLYQEATTRAAEVRVLVPNKAQSIPWETTRGLFSPAQRRNEQFRAMANQIWNDFQRGKISLDVAHLQLHDLAGGVTPPAWVAYPAKPVGPK